MSVYSGLNIYGHCYGTIRTWLNASLLRIRSIGAVSLGCSTCETNGLHSVAFLSSCSTLVTRSRDSRAFSRPLLIVGGFAFILALGRHKCSKYIAIAAAGFQASYLFSINQMVRYNKALLYDS